MVKAIIADPAHTHRDIPLLVLRFGRYELNQPRLKFLLRPFPNLIRPLAINFMTCSRAVYQSSPRARITDGAA
jgi:hypothetical protein